MSVLTPIFTFAKVWEKSPRQIISHSWSDRKKVLAHDVNMYCWRRGDQQEIYSYLQRLLKKELHPISTHCSQANLKEKIALCRREWEEKCTADGDIFWSDVYQLTYDFLSFSPQKTGTLHLKVISNNACTKFHTDGYSLRLFTTYYGQGTEWLPEKAVNRKALGTNNDKIVKLPNEIQQLNTFDVGILKGELPNRYNRTRGIVHRSPQIEGVQLKRIVLRVDM